MKRAWLLAALAGGFLLGRRSYDWRGRVVLIAGGSRGLGLLLARRLGQRGAHLVLAARDAGELTRAKEGLARAGIEAHVVVADVAKEEQAYAMVVEAVARYGRLDVLINTASIIPVAPMEALAIEDYQAAMDVNFWGTVHSSRAALPHLERRKGARIVNVSSIGGVVAVPHLLAYCCGKFATTGFSQGMQAEVARRGVRVVTVIPWLMRTGSAGHALVKGQRKKEAALFNLAAALPVITVDAERAADRIVRATERGERFVTIGALGKAMRIANALAPGLFGAALSGVARLLPDAQKGAAAEPLSEAKDHPSSWTRGPLTTLAREAAEKNNEAVSHFR